MLCEGGALRNGAMSKTTWCDNVQLRARAKMGEREIVASCGTVQRSARAVATMLNISILAFWLGSSLGQY